MFYRNWPINVPLWRVFVSMNIIITIALMSRMSYGSWIRVLVSLFGAILLIYSWLLLRVTNRSLDGGVAIVCLSHSPWLHDLLFKSIRESHLIDWRWLSRESPLNFARYLLRSKSLSNFSCFPSILATALRFSIMGWRLCFNSLRSCQKVWASANEWLCCFFRGSWQRWIQSLLSIKAVPIAANRVNDMFFDAMH
jgi:hypothetical protein